MNRSVFLFGALGKVCTSVARHDRRHFFGILNQVFNRPDPERIREVGPDRSCAEWLLRCGAHVKWQESNKWHKDYNSLPAHNFKKYKIEEVDATEAAIMEIGFVHFDGVKHLKRIIFHHCPHLSDEALGRLNYLKDSLEHLQLTSCGDITDRGLATVAELKLLKTLELFDLPEVRDKKGSYNRLVKALPDCKIDYKDLDKDKGG